MAKRRPSTRGAVHIGECNGSLRLLWTHKRKRYTLALGLKDGYPWHKKLATDRAMWMEREIKFGHFDPEQMEQYRAFLHGEDVSLKDSPQVKTLPLGEMWRKYVATKHGKSPSTTRQYGWVERHIERLPTDDMRQSQSILDALNCLNPGTRKRLLTQFCACGSWAMNSGLITENPFIGTAAAVKVTALRTTEDEIHPFSRSDRDQIIQALKDSQHYQNYADLVVFLFFTGCRPSEAVALQWKQIKGDHILFNQARVQATSGYETKAGLKTQRYRRFPINSQLQAMLNDRPSHQPEDLVFPSPSGTAIDWGNFTRRAWRSILDSLPHIPYRNPYQMRHSFISHCKEKGVQSITIAEWVGNSVEMVERVYARTTEAFSVPEL